ncbi:MAG: ribulose-phosphate 3-epimerase [Planctomycetes bacterium]|nr:ribulose-phosphate 3-epimerase [Planctomycetota bacterium]
MPPIRIAPSLLAADFSRLKDEIQKVEAAGADLLHLDVMDGHFVPNLTIGPVVVEWVRKVTRLPLDCHLMILHPEEYVGAFADAGADIVTFHAEAVAQDYALKRKDQGYAMTLVCKQLYDFPRVDRIVNTLRGKGKRVGLAVNPDTDAEVAAELLPKVDMVLAMTVWPGFGGQKFIESVVPKVGRLRAMSPTLDIEVDGGLNADTVKRAAGAGANVIVAGTATFRSDDVNGVIRTLRENAEAASAKK